MSRRESRSASVSTTAARKVRSYARMRRREDGFDMSGPEKPWGEYSPYKGGSYYFNAYQDRRASRVLQQYPQKTGQEGDDEPYKSSRMRRTTLADDIKQTVQRDSDHLLLTVARLLIDESCVRAEPPVAATPQHSAASSKRPKRKAPIMQNSTTSRPASAWKGRGTRKSVSSLSLNGSISSISVTPSHSTLQDTKKSSSRTATPAGLAGHRTVRLADRSSSPVQQSTTARPLTAHTSNRRSSARRSSTPVSQPTPPQPSFTYAPPVPVSSSTPSPPPSNPLHSTSIQTRNYVQDAGTNTDAETRSISTQTAVDSDTQTELSYLMGRRPPFLPLSESTFSERVTFTSPSVGVQSSFAQENDTTIPAHQGSLDGSTATEMKKKKDKLQGLEKEAEKQSEEQQEEVTEQQEEVAEQQEVVTEQQEEVAEQQEEAAEHQEEVAEHQEELMEQQGEVAEQQEEVAEHQEEVAEQQEVSSDNKEPIDKFKAAEERVKKAEQKVIDAEKELRKAENELKEADEALQEADDVMNASTADKEKTRTEAAEEMELQETSAAKRENSKETDGYNRKEEVTEEDTKEEVRETNARRENTRLEEMEGDNKGEEAEIREEVTGGDSEREEETRGNKTEAFAKEEEADTREEEADAKEEDFNAVRETPDMREDVTEEAVVEEPPIAIKKEMETKKESVVSEENAKAATDNHKEDSDSASRSNSQTAEEFSYSALPPTPPPRDPELYTDHMAQAIKATNPTKDSFWESD